MCLLAICYRMVDDAPLVVGANREELYARTAEPPQILEGPARAVGGVDRLARGTWLGVNENGMLVAVTNRLKTDPVLQPRSRGLLARELLGCRTTLEAIQLATQELELKRYEGCNIIIADAERLTIFQAGDWLRVKPMPPGLHVITNHDINDCSDARLAFALDWLWEHPLDTPASCIQSLQQLCRITGNDHPDICLHGVDRGTVSSSIIVLRKRLPESVYLHSPGPPDCTDYQDYSPLLRQISPRTAAHF